MPPSSSPAATYISTTVQHTLAYISSKPANSGAYEALSYGARSSRDTRQLTIARLLYNGHDARATDQAARAGKTM